MSEYERVTKPENIKKEIKRQHLDWVDVMGKQVKTNYARHIAQVKKDGGRIK